MSSFRQQRGDVGTLAPSEVQRAYERNRIAFGQAVAKGRAEKHLIDFIRLMWKVTDPGTPLRVGWAMEAICEHLEAVSNGQIRNLLINVPPGFSKSLCTDTFWPAWEWGPRKRADLRFLSWSYAEKLTKINNEKCRDIIRSPLYQALWGDRFKLKRDQDEKLFFKNDAGGFKLASSIGGVGTGLRGDRLVLDDPHSVDGADSDAERQKTIGWFGGTMSSRVRNANDYPELVDGMMAEPTSTVIIMQRVHRRDVSGIILDEGLPFEHLLIEMEYEGVDHPARRTVGWRASSIGWVDPRAKAVADADAQIATLGTFRSERQKQGLETPVEAALTNLGEAFARVGRDVATLADPQRFARPTIEAHKKKMRLKHGSNAVASQFRQWPFEGTGTLFKREWFVFCDMADVPPSGKDDCRGWDLAASDNAQADATATVKLRMDRAGVIYVLHAKAVRKSPGGVEDFIKEVATADGRGVIQSFPQDPGSAGKHLITHLSRSVLQGFRFRSSPEMKSKSKRAEPFASQVEHKNVRVVRGPWNEEYVTELVEFPYGLHDDQVDATSRAYDALLHLNTAVAPVAPKVFSST